MCVSVFGLRGHSYGHAPILVSIQRGLALTATCREKRPLNSQPQPCEDAQVFLAWIAQGLDFKVKNAEAPVCIEYQSFHVPRAPPESREPLYNTLELQTWHMSAKAQAQAAGQFPAPSIVS